jgi:hypothetical protein
MPGLPFAPPAEVLAEPLPELMPVVPVGRVALLPLEPMLPDFCAELSPAGLEVCA